ncbi:MAG: hypothetical protein KDE35_18480 [Geminicoccaceae bacterium]|nr:hypothetical protein [Geminicoccaceae bacterium]
MTGSRASTDEIEDARAARTAYETCRDAELAAAPWTFALHRTVLTTAAPAPAFGFARALVLPADCLRVVMVGRDPATMRVTGWTSEGRTILTDEEPGLPLVHVRRITDPSRFAPSFVEALACRLAMELAEQLTGSTTKVDMLDRQHERALAEARRISAIQRPPAPMTDGERWLGSRPRARIRCSTRSVAARTSTCASSPPPRPSCSG